jgi:hypothetical protein
MFADVGIIGAVTNASPDAPSSDTMYTLSFVGEIRETVPGVLVTRAEVENGLVRDGASRDIDTTLLGRLVEKMFDGKMERGVVRCHNGGIGSASLWTVTVVAIVFQPTLLLARHGFTSCTIYR